MYIYILYNVFGMYQNEVPLFVRTISQNLRLRALLDIQIVCMYIYIYVSISIYFSPKTQLV